MDLPYIMTCGVTAAFWAAAAAWSQRGRIEAGFYGVLYFLTRRSDHIYRREVSSDSNVTRFKKIANKSVNCVHFSPNVSIFFVVRHDF